MIVSTEEPTQQLAAVVSTVDRRFVTRSKNRSALIAWKKFSAACAAGKKTGVKLMTNFRLRGRSHSFVMTDFC